MDMKLPIFIWNAIQITGLCQKKQPKASSKDVKDGILQIHKIFGPREANLVLIAYASSESRGTFRQKARSLAPLNGWACTAVKICHDGILEDTNSLDGAHFIPAIRKAR